MIDPAGFTGGPKGTHFRPEHGREHCGEDWPDGLKGVEFFMALPSPPFVSAKLDAVRPLVNAATLRVKPVVDGVTIENRGASARATAACRSGAWAYGRCSDATRDAAAARSGDR